MAWHAIECADHCEGFVSSGLHGLKLDVCLPRIARQVKMPRGKVAEIIEPLFPGYVLAAWGEGYDWSKVRRLPGVEHVCHVVGDTMRPATINQMIVETLQRNMDERGVLRCLDGEWMLEPRPVLPPIPFPAQLKAGQVVTVEGFNLPALVEWHAGARVGVLMDMLGGRRSVTVKRVQVRAA